MENKKLMNNCIYCGSKSDLSDEHIIPAGLGGSFILQNGSCLDCAKVTGKLEQRLLRGHWWPYRLRLGLKSNRRKNEVIPDFIIKIIHTNNNFSEARIGMLQQTVVLIFKLDIPTILSGEVKIHSPYATEMYLKYLAPLPKIFGVNGKIYALKTTDKIEVPINFNADDLFRFLAKIAHGWAYFEYGNICSEYFLPSIILGDTSKSMSYIGGVNEHYLLKGEGIHSIISEIKDNFLVVYIQLFRDKGDIPPIYQVVVGKINS